MRLGWGLVEFKGYCSCLGVGWGYIFDHEKPSKRTLRDAELGMATRVLRLRVKDKHAAVLKAQDLGLEVLGREGRCVSAFEVAAYTKGAGKEGLTLHSQTIQAVSEEYVLRRKQFGRVQLRWRASGGAKRALSWIPFKAAAISYKNGQSSTRIHARKIISLIKLHDKPRRSGREE